MLRIVVALFASLACWAPLYAGTAEEAYAAVDQWVAAFNANDPERTVAAYTPDAFVLGTVSPGLASSAGDLRAYFGASAAARSQVKMGEWSARVLSNDAVVFAGFYEFSRPVEGKLLTAPARFSFVAVRRDGAWKLLHHHSSMRPAPPAAAPK